LEQLPTEIVLKIIYILEKMRQIFNHSRTRFPPEKTYKQEQNKQMRFSNPGTNLVPRRADMVYAEVVEKQR